MRHLVCIILLSLLNYRSTDEIIIIPQPVEDTIDTGLPDGWIFEKVFYYSDSFNVPKDLVYEIGLNESGWRNPNDSNYIQQPDYVPGEPSYGDLQMLNSTWNTFSKKLNLKEKNRETLLIASIYLLKYCYTIGDSSWYKARYIYARGKWKEPNKWTKLEKKFMSKIDFTKYEK